MFSFLRGPEPTMVTQSNALPGHDSPAFVVPTTHVVLGTPLLPPYPDGIQTMQFGLGCFWGAEKLFWKLDGVYSTAVGYAGGFTNNPTYREVCSGKTGHTEIVLVAFDPAKVSAQDVLRAFWEGHDPTQGMRQGNDVGTQYRSMIVVDNAEQRALVDSSRNAYQRELTAAGFGRITTEIVDGAQFFAAEENHQQYLAKNPGGYCGLGGTGVSCPIGLTS